MVPQNYHHAFTTKFSGRSNVLVTDIKLSQAYRRDRDGVQVPPLFDAQAIWDTGATISNITEGYVSKLGLKPVSKTEVNYPSGKAIKDVYFINVYLPNKVVMSYIKAVECEKLVGGHDFLVGMDIIGAGDFSVTHADGKTTMSYRIPSVETIDYIPATNVHNKKLNSNRKVNVPRAKLRDKRKSERENRKKGRKQKH